MKKKLLIISFIFGLLFFCMYKEWIIIYWNNPFLKTTHIFHEKKTIEMTIYKNNELLKKNATIIYEQNKIEKLKSIINAWLLYAYDQQLIFKKIKLEKVMVSESDECFLSFSETIFDEASTAKEQLYLIESLLKTVRDNKITFKNSMFLVGYEPLHSEYLDFSLPWPQEGFINL